MRKLSAAGSRSMASATSRSVYVLSPSGPFICPEYQTLTHDLSHQSCPAERGRPGNGMPTPADSRYPPCGNGLAGCVNGLYCKPLEANCASVLQGGGCLGICVPSFSQPSWGPAQQPRPGQQQPRPAQQQPRPALQQPRPAQQQPRPAQIQPRPVQQQPRPQQPAGSCPSDLECPSGYVCVQDSRTNGFRCASLTS
jgi:hypothetical protein